MVQLDGLRCFAVMMVFWQHSGTGILTRFGHYGIGVYGVRLFFVISGFLITGILLRARDSAPGFWPAVRAFYARRFLRIFPIYYLSIAIALALGIGFVARDLFWHLTYLSNWNFMATGEWPKLVRHLWSLSVEEQFYLVWPCLVLLAPRRKLPALFIATIAFGMLSRLAFSIFSGHYIAILTPTTNSLDSLAAGSLLAWLRYDDPARGLDVKWERLLLPVAGVLLLAIPAVMWLGRGIKIFDLVEAPAATLISVWLVNRAAGGRMGVGGRLLSWRPIVYLGTISYGLYLYQGLVGWAIERTGVYRTFASWAGGFEPMRDFLHRTPGNPGSPMEFVFLAGFTVLVAAISWRIFERPINNLKRYFPYPTA